MEKKTITPIMTYTEDGVTKEVVLNFGIGRFAIGGGYCKGDKMFDPAVFLIIDMLKDSLAPGTDVNEHIDQIDNDAPRFVLNFFNEESLDVVLDQLMKIKENFNILKQQ